MSDGGLNVVDETVAVSSVSNSASSDIAIGFVNCVGIGSSISISVKGSSFVASFPVVQLKSNYEIFIVKSEQKNLSFKSYFIIWPGIDTLAESTFRIWPLRMLKDRKIIIIILR